MEFLEIADPCMPAKDCFTEEELRIGQAINLFEDYIIVIFFIFFEENKGNINEKIISNMILFFKKELEIFCDNFFVINLDFLIYSVDFFKQKNISLYRRKKYTCEICKKNFYSRIFDVWYFDNRKYSKIECIKCETEKRKNMKVNLIKYLKGGKMYE